VNSLPWYASEEFLARIGGKITRAIQASGSNCVLDSLHPQRISELLHTQQSYLIALIDHCTCMMLLLSVVGFQPVGLKGLLERAVASDLAAGPCLRAWQLKILCVLTHPL
jgi:hypothetical protein